MRQQGPVRAGPGSSEMDDEALPPTLAEIRAAAGRLAGRVVRTPVLDWDGPEIRARLAPGTRLSLKLELFQRTGSFKPRGALAVMLGLPGDALARGVTAVSTGNHAIATAWAARELGSHAKVVMFAAANPARVPTGIYTKRQLAGDALPRDELEILV